MKTLVEKTKYSNHMFGPSIMLHEVDGKFVVNVRYGFSNWENKTFDNPKDAEDFFNLVVVEDKL